MLLIRQRMVALILTLFILLLQNVSSQIYTPNGTPNIINVISKQIEGGGAHLTINLRNNATESAGFQVHAECDKGFSQRQGWSGTIDSKEIKNIELDIFGENYCSETITCKVIADNILETEIDEHSISFTNDCSLCKSSYKVCNKGTIYCSNNEVRKCNDFCNDDEIIRNCREGCELRDGNPICNEDIKNNNIYIVILVVALIIILFFIYLKIKKRNPQKKR